MSFYGLPTPSVDETLSSWLFRCSFNPYTANFTRLVLAERPSQWWEGLELKSADPDTDFLSASRRMGAGREHINPDLLSNYFSLCNDTLVEWSRRRFFCPDCLRDDVASGHLPMWRKSWCYVHSCICSVHDQELIALSDASHYSKAWDAFVQVCNSVSGSITAKDSRLPRFRSTTLMKVEHSLACSRVTQQNILVDLFNRLLSIFLQSPFRGSRGGAARIHFQSERGMRFADPPSFEQSISKGPSTADPSSRFGSVVFAASLLGILPHSRFLMFTKACEDAKTGMLIPKDLHRAAAFPYVDRAGYRVLHRYLGNFPRKDFPLLDRHLQLQEARYAREGVLSGHPFGVTLD
ncbi:TniQ family protein [Pseudomonas sp. Ga0074129]|uniref:TniQ family protein n=1 Tax=Pseudomonas sp. Ga0074129 TaxID=1752219 RepID=UPI00343E9A81